MILDSVVGSLRRAASALLSEEIPVLSCGIYILMDPDFYAQSELLQVLKLSLPLLGKRMEGWTTETFITEVVLSIDLLNVHNVEAI